MDKKHFVLDLVSDSGYIGSPDTEIFTREGSVTLARKIRRDQRQIERFEERKQLNRNRMFGEEPIGHTQYNRLKRENRSLTKVQDKLKADIVVARQKHTGYKLYIEPEYNLIFKKPIEDLERPYHPNLVHFGDIDTRNWDEVTRGSRSLKDLTLEDTSQLPQRRAGYNLGAFTAKDRDTWSLFNEGIFHYGLDSEREGIF